VRFGDLPAEAGALAVGTTVKLARALWIVPLTLGTAFVKRQEAHPMVVVHFVLLPGGGVNTYLAAGREVYPWIVWLARFGLTVTLFLIGCGIFQSDAQKSRRAP